MSAGLPAVIGPKEPFTPPDCDLRSYDWFPLHHKRLRRSAWWLRASDTAKALSLELWCAAYEEVPAGSLPNDDVALAELAGFGRRNIAPWLEIREEVLSAWTLCSDGRWYHATLCEVALEAWIDRVAFKIRSAKGNKKRHGTAFDLEALEAARADAHRRLALLKGAALPPSRSGGSSLKEAVKAPQGSDKTGQGQDSEKRKEQAPSKGSGAAKAAAPRARAKVPPHARGTRLPLAWFAAPELRAYAAEQGFTPEEIDGMEDDFRNWWPAQPGSKGRKTDWNLTWKTWVRTERKRRDERRTRTGTPRGGARDTDNLGDMHAGLMAAAQKGK